MKKTKLKKIKEKRKKPGEDGASGKDYPGRPGPNYLQTKPAGGLAVD